MSVVLSALFFWKRLPFLLSICCSLIWYGSTRVAIESTWSLLSWPCDLGLANHGAQCFCPGNKHVTQANQSESFLEIWYMNLEEKMLIFLLGSPARMKWVWSCLLVCPSPPFTPCPFLFSLHTESLVSVGRKKRCRKVWHRHLRP